LTVNRGVWTLGERAEKERIATLSYDGTVRVVAQVAGRELIHYHHGTKARYALIGEVLPPGSPIREALIGREVDHHRNPVTYFDTTRLEQLKTPRAIAVRRTSVHLDDSQQGDAVSVTARGGRFSSSLDLSPANAIKALTIDDRVFIVDTEAKPLRLGATAIVATTPLPASGRDAVQTPIELVAVLNEGDELPLDDPDLLIPLTRSLEPGGGEVAQAAADRLEALWQRHLEHVGWWGDLSQAQADAEQYRRIYGAATAPAAVEIGSGVPTNSRAAFDALASSSGGPTSLAMAAAYLKVVGPAEDNYSISALPSTAASSSRRRAFTISIGVTEVFFVELEPSSGELTSWAARVAREQSGAMARWLDLVFETRSNGTYAQGRDPRAFFRSVFDEDDQGAIRAGARELVVGGKGYRRPDWHNPFLNAAVQPESSVGAPASR
jgi:hypothetical protein